MGGLEQDVFLRRELIRQNLADYVDESMHYVVGVGGNLVAEAIGLSGKGYDVTLLEPELELSAPESVRIHSVPASLDAIKERANRYDLVLSDGLLSRAANPGPAVMGLVNLAKPGGIISLAETGFAPERLGTWLTRASAQPVSWLLARVIFDDPESSITEPWLHVVAQKHAPKVHARRRAA